MADNERDYTDNLELVLPKQGEQYNVDDFNDNSLKIDTFATNTGINIGNINTAISNINSNTANKNLSNLSSTGQAKFDDLQDGIDTKVSKTGDTMTGRLDISTDDYPTQTPSSPTYFTSLTIKANDVRRGSIGLGYLPDGQDNLFIQNKKVINGVTKDNTLCLGFDANGNDFISWQGNKVQIVKETYVNGTSWYREWTDGWIEQGGKITINAQGANTTQTTTVNLLKTMSTTNYYVAPLTFMADGGNTTGLRNHFMAPYTTNLQIGTYSTTAVSNSYTAAWYICGY